MRMKFPTTSFFRLLFPWRHVPLVEQAAGEVARQCRSRLWGRVCRRTANMSIAEIRGYVRAQAAGCVAGEVDYVLCHRCLKPALRNRVVDAAVDQLVSMVARDILSREPPANTKTMAA